MENDNNIELSNQIMDEILDILSINKDDAYKTMRKKDANGNDAIRYTHAIKNHQILNKEMLDKFTRNKLQFKLKTLFDRMNELIDKDDEKLKALNKDDSSNKRNRDTEDEEEPSNIKKFKKTADKILENEDEARNNNISEEELKQHKLKKENDPLYKNPKLEYVEPQTLPKVMSLMGLFNENEDQKIEKFPNAQKKLTYLRQKYGVSRFPKRDLIADLPAKFPDLDLTQPKPPTQIQFSTFLSYIEPFFRRFVDKDEEFLSLDYVVPNRILFEKQIVKTENIKKKYLKEKNSKEVKNEADMMIDILFDDINDNKMYDPNVTPYLIPRLGKLYLIKWFEDNPNMISLLSNPSGFNLLDASSNAYSQKNLQELKALLTKFPSIYNHFPQLVLPKGDSSLFISAKKSKDSNDTNNSLSSSTEIAGKGKPKGRKPGVSAATDVDKSLDGDNVVSLGPLSTRLMQCLITDSNLQKEFAFLKHDDEDNNLEEEKVSLELMQQKLINENKLIDFKLEDKDNYDIDDDEDDEEENEDDDEYDEDEEELLNDEEDFGFDEIYEADVKTLEDGRTSENFKPTIESSTVPFTWKIENPKILSSLNYESFEERIKQELKSLGVFAVANKSIGRVETESEGKNLGINWVKEKEDDEVCSELRTLQKKLRVVNNRNNQRKQILKPILKKHLAYQDYAQILDNLNKQVDHEYARRLKNSHSKKKKHKHTITEVHNVNENAIAELSGDAGNTISNPDSTASQQFQQQQEIQHGIADINLKKLLEKRKKWMDAIGVIFANEESEEETEHLGNKTEDDDHIPLNIKKYMVSENEFLMDGVEEIGAKSIDPAVNMKRPPAKDVFKNV